MNKTLAEQMEGLLEKYTELLVGETSDDMKQKVEAWIIYNHIAKSMPHLAKHWNSTYPDAKEGIMQVIKQIKELNERNSSEKN